MKKKTLASLEIAIVLCSMLLVSTLPGLAANQTMQKVSASTITAASEDDDTLDIYGNANVDDTIDMRDVTFIARIILRLEEPTALADANFDGEINVLDMTQIGLINRGKEKELTIEDCFGEAETVREPVKRIVSLWSPELEVLRALKTEDKIVGVNKMVKYQKLYFPQLSKLPSVGDIWTGLDYEAILDLNPDILLTFQAQQGQGAQRKMEWERKLPGVTIISLDLDRPEAFTENVKMLGYILQKEDEAEEFIDWHDGYMDKIKSRTDGLSDDKKPKVFVWDQYTQGGSYTTGCKGTIYHSICTIAGGENIAEDLLPSAGPWFFKVEPEWVIEQNPDIITASVSSSSFSCGYGTDNPSGMVAAREQILTRPELVLANANAVKSGRVYIL